MITRPDGSQVAIAPGLVPDEVFAEHYTVEGWYLVDIYKLYMRDKKILCCGESWDGYYSDPFNEWFNNQAEFEEFLKQKDSE